MNSPAPGDRRAAVVIEDDLDIRNLVCAVLEQGGFAVSGATTGREGVDVIRQQHPMVVTLDIGLPDIDGYEVLRRIRSTTDCYVIVLSGALLVTLFGRREDEHEDPELDPHVGA